MQARFTSIAAHWQYLVILSKLFRLQLNFYCTHNENISNQATI